MNTHKPYHHGNLRTTLVDAALEVARKRGPEAVRLRETARRAGVSPAAVYRHFANQSALVRAVTVRISDELAGRMHAELAKVEPGSDPIETSLSRLRAICYGYIMFAQEDSEVFRSMWNKNIRHASILEIEAREDEPFLLLSTTVDDLIKSGYIDANQAVPAKTTIWATAHGIAMLALDGPIRDVPEEERRRLIHAAIDIVLRGIGSHGHYPD